MRALLFFLIVMSRTIVVAQDEPRANTQYVDMMVGIGKVVNLSISYQVGWKFGEKQRLVMGVGARVNNSIATGEFFTTAPAKLVKGEAGPAALFKEPIPANIDSVLLPTARVYSLNAMLHIGYNFSEKFGVGFNIDVIGASFGGSTSGTYYAGTVSTPVTASPSGFNLLLVGENDLGTLNSEFFVGYRINEKMMLKAGIQHIFMEYTTSQAVQQFPEPNDRFRITPTIFCAGLAYKLR